MFVFSWGVVVFVLFWSSARYLCYLYHLLVATSQNVFYEAWYDVARFRHHAQRTDTTAFITFSEEETNAVLDNARRLHTKPYPFFMFAMFAGSAVFLRRSNVFCDFAVFHHYHH